MAKVRFAARVGAAAFLAGASLAVPQSIAIATADRTNATSAADSANSTADGNDAPQRARAAVRGARGGNNSDDPAPRAAATAPSAAASRATATIGRSRPVADRPAPAAQPSTDVTDAVDSSQPASTPAAPAREIPVAAPAVVTSVPAPSTAAPTVAPAVAPVLATVSAAAVPAATAAPSPANAGAVSVVTASAASNATSSTAALIDRLLAPITRLFGEGTALLIRRQLFNQAPTTNPVQLTGQSEGPITGTVGAVDPEGDPLTYRITGTPLYGTAVVNADGSYTYTPAPNFAGIDSFVVDVTDGGSHINLLDFRRPASTSANVGVTQGAVAAMLRFQFIYGAGSQYWSSAARSALESAATRLSSYIVVTSPVTVTYEVTGTKSAFSSTLASAGSDFVPGNAGFLQTVVQNKILTGNDTNGSAADGTIDWNFGPSWGFSSVTSNQYDFQSIAMHELIHTLGFMSNVDRAGSNTGKVWTVFDSYIVSSTGAPIINSSTYVFNTAYNSDLTGGNDGMYFKGPNAVAANGGPVRLYTPNQWEPGSSMSHLAANYLMKAIINSGPGFREVSPVELAILSDIGYTVTSGPGAPVLLFVGFVTLRVRRRKD